MTLISNRSSIFNASFFKILAGCVLLAVAFAAEYVRYEQPVYYWDYVLYWNFYQMYGAEFPHHMISDLYAILRTIAAQDYNASTIIPLLPIYPVLGGSRIVYVCAITALYLGPALALMIAYLRFFRKPASELLVLLLTSVFLFPVFWATSLRGMVDVAGLIPLAGALFVVRQTHFLTRASSKKAVQFGLMLWGMFLFRRWYAFTVVALASMTFVWGAIALWQEGKATPADMKRFFVTNMYAGLACLIPALIFQGPLLYRILHTSYAEMYIGYQGTPGDMVKAYAYNFGFFVLAFSFIGISHAIAKRQFTNLFELNVGILTALIFAHVQMPGMQHRLPIAFFLLPSYWGGLSFVAAVGRPWARYALILAVVMNFINTYVPVSWGAGEPLKLAFASVHNYPLRYEHFPEYQRMVDDLEALPRDAKVTVFASSDILTASLLNVMDPQLAPRMQVVAEVDARDGFYWDTLNSDYFLVGTPTPLHLGAQNQRIIEIPADDIVSGSGFGADLQDTGKTYNLERGVTGHIYKRIRPLSATHVAQLAEQFYQYYPQWRDKDRTNAHLLLVLASITLGDVSGKIEAEAIDDKVLLMKAGETSPTSLSYQSGEGFAPDQIKASVKKSKKGCKDTDRVDLTLTGNGAENVYPIVPGRSVSFNVPKAESISLSVSAHEGTVCNSLELSFQ